MAKTNIMTSARAKFVTQMVCFIAGTLAPLGSVLASSWSPTVLVNTEAFQMIDDSDTASDVYIQFGQTLDKTITYERSAARFSFDDDIYVAGGVEATGTMTGSKLYVENAGSPVLVTRTTTERVGIGTNNPDRKLEVVGTISGSTLRATNALRSSGSLVWEGSASGASLWTSRFEGAGLADCDNATTSKLLWDTTTGKFSCGTDQNSGGGGGAPDTASFTDTDPAAWNGDDDTVELFDDGTKANLVTDSSSATVLVTVRIEGNASNTSADSNLAARVVYTTDGNDPSCSTSTQLGEDMVTNFVTSTAQYWGDIHGTFLHSPGIAGTMKYTVCSSSAGGGTMSDTATSISVVLVELGG